MTTLSEPRILIAERTGNGVFVQFADGESALFPSSFLKAHLPWYVFEVKPNIRLLVEDVPAEAA